MKIYALNGMQEHTFFVRKHVEITGSVVLRGCLDPDGNVQLLEGSHRIAFAVELGIPVTVVLFGHDEWIPNESEIESKITGDKDMCAVSEFLKQSLEERGLYNQAVYEIGGHQGIRIVDPAPETGTVVHRRLTDTENNPWAAFPERTWQYPWGHGCYVEGKQVTGVGRCQVQAGFGVCQIGRQCYGD